MRQAYKAIILFLALAVTAGQAHSQHSPPRPPVRVDRPEISFELVQASGGVMQVRMTNKGETPLRFYDNFASRDGSNPEFRLCDTSLDKCREEEWINPNFRVSSVIMLPADLSLLRPGDSIDREIGIESMLALGEIYDPDPGLRLQIKFDVMLNPYFEEYVEYVSAWMPLGTLMRP